MNNVIKQPFQEYDADKYFKIIENNVTLEIEKQTNDYILGVDNQNYINYLIAKYTIPEIAVDFKSIDVRLLKKEEHRDERPYGDPLYGWPHIYTKFFFSISIKYIGSTDILRLHVANGFTWSISREASPIDINGDHLTLYFIVYKNSNDSDQQFKNNIIHEKEETISVTFGNLNHTLDYVRILNSRLSQFIEKQFSEYKSKAEKEQSVLDSLGITDYTVDPNKYTVPVFRRNVPKPLLLTTVEKHAVISNDIYKDILTIIYNVYKGFERLPNNYRDKDEESLRDAILPTLQVNYSSWSTTGETFNKEGKTDICIKAKNGDNVFIAECKIWKGEKLFLEAINQLFDRYLTIRDTKAALIIFVKNDGFTDIWDKIQNVVITHNYFTRTNGHTANTSNSYIFHHPQDEKVEINLEVMAFHFPERIIH